VVDGDDQRGGYLRVVLVNQLHGFSVRPSRVGVRPLAQPAELRPASVLGRSPTIASRAESATRRAAQPSISEARFRGREAATDAATTRQRSSGPPVRGWTSGRADRFILGAGDHARSAAVPRFIGTGTRSTGRAKAGRPGSPDRRQWSGGGACPGSRGGPWSPVVRLVSRSGVERPNLAHRRDKGYTIRRDSQVELVPGAPGDRLTLQIGAAPRATGDQTAFRHPVRTLETAATTYPLKVVGPRVYFWRVAARVGGRWSAYSPAEHFTVPPPKG
jgi:hypothetical protein